MLKALYELQLMPRIVSGSSVGSIMASILCCSPEDRLLSLLEPCNVNVNAFDWPGQTWPMLYKIMRLLQKGIFLD